MITSTGKILIGGKGGLSRSNGDGTWDSEFSVSFMNYAEIYGLLELPDGRFFVTGEFGISGTETYRCVVLDPDGSVSENTLTYPFEPSDGVGPALLDGEDLIFAGRFSWTYSGFPPALPFNRIARFNTNPIQNPANAVYFDRSSIMLIEVEADTPEISDRIHISRNDFILYDNDPVEFDIEIEDNDDVLTGPVEATLRIVPEAPEAAAFLGSPTTMKVRILDNEVAGGIRFDRFSLQLVSGQDEVEIQTLIAGKLDWTELIYEIETDDPDWNGDANFHPDQEWVGGRSSVSNLLSLNDLNDGILKNGTARVRIRTLPDQPELLGEPSVLELSLYDKPGYAAVVEHKAALTDANWSLVWRNDTDPDFASELVLTPPSPDGSDWAEIRLPDPISGSGFVRIRYETMPRE